MRNSRIRFMRVRSMTIPACTGTESPERPVPAPRGVTGILSRLASFMTSETCAVVSTHTAHEGRARCSEAS